MMAEERGIEKPKIVKEDILYIQTQVSLIGINLSEENQPADHRSKGAPFPSSMKVVKLAENGFPIGMGVLKLDNQILMFGGEKVKKGTTLRDVIMRRALDRSVELPQGLNLDVYQFNHKDGSLYKTDIIPRMQAGKCTPLVLKIRDKIYVHHILAYFQFFEFATDPLCESYDLSSRKWEPVDILPVQLNRRISQFGLEDMVPSTQFVVCNKFFIPDVDYRFKFPGKNKKCYRKTRRIFCFDLDSNTWDLCSASNLEKPFLDCNLPYPCSGTSFSLLKIARSMRMKYGQMTPEMPYSAFLFY